MNEHTTPESSRPEGGDAAVSPAAEASTERALEATVQVTPGAAVNAGAAPTDPVEPLVLPGPDVAASAAAPTPPQGEQGSGTPPKPVKEAQPVRWLTPARASLAAVGIAVLGITGGAGVGFALGAHAGHSDRGQWAEGGFPGGPGASDGRGGPGGAQDGGMTPPDFGGNGNTDENGNGGSGSGSGGSGSDSSGSGQSNTSST